MQTRIDNEEFVLDSVMVICNSVPDARNQRVVLEDRQLFHQLLELLSRFDQNIDVVRQVVTTCIRLSTNEDVSQIMASEGMSYFMRTAANLGTPVPIVFFFFLFFLMFFTISFFCKSSIIVSFIFHQRKYFGLM
jgi:hypothetical protein